MLNVTQSQYIEVLALKLQHDLQQQVMGVFDAHQVIVPSHGVGEWLNFYFAAQWGISAQVEFSFFGVLQRELLLAVLGEERMPKNALLNKQAMQWQIFSYFIQRVAQVDLVHVVDTDAEQALSTLLQRIQQLPLDKQQRALWHMSAQIAEVFYSYMNYRSDWLQDYWGKGELLPIPKQKIMAEQSEHTGGKQIETIEDIPDWLNDRYVGMQQWQQYLWKTLFHDAFVARQNSFAEFWQQLKQQPQLSQQLPQHISLFTLLQLPKADFDFIEQLAQYIRVDIYHFNPSQEYWADVVDDLWLKRKKDKNPTLTASMDSQHVLLSRFAKQARDIFRFLVELSGNERNGDGEWVDAFVTDESPRTLLQKIKQDVFYLHNATEADWQLAADDRSIQVHACHSLTRQLEVLREQLIQWFAADSSRQASDVLVLIPNLADTAPLVRAVFDLAPDEFYLPITITGLVPPDAELFWHAFVGRYSLLDGRFDIDQLLAWLELDAVQQVYGLSRDAVSRLAQLLAEVGFKRGFDSAHLRQTLDSADHDDRFTLQYALKRLMLGMVMPAPVLHGNILSTHLVARQDFELIATLSAIYQDLHAVRTLIVQQDKSIMHWLTLLEQELIERFNVMVDSTAYRSTAKALAEVRQAIERTESQDIVVPLRFVLDEVMAVVQQALPGSHPTGKITVSRLGTLRPLPYRLVVMLNLDAGVFPNRDIKNNFDLMDVFPARKGDRSRREDDRGAFLDGLLLAKDACWLFYNGFNVQDPQPRQPSGTLQEFMDFVASKLILASSHSQTTTQAITQLPAQLWQQHQLQPFDVAYFDAQQPQSFQGVWFDIACQLQRAIDEQPWSNQAISRHALPQIQLSLREVMRDLNNPAQHYLSTLRIRQIQKVESSDTFELLSLNKLQQYALRDAHLQQRDSALGIDQLQDQLPVGAAHEAYWRASLLEAAELQQRLAVYGGEVNPLTEHVLALEQADGQQFALRIHVPLPITQSDSGAAHCRRWVAQYASAINAKRTLYFWLEHLAWQVWRQTTEAQVAANDGERIVLYKKNALRAAPIEASQAKNDLLQWLWVWQQAAQKPWILPPALMLDSQGVKKDKTTGELGIHNLAKLHDMWLGRSYDYLGREPIDKEDCAEHPSWQMLLRGQDAVTALDHFIDQYAISLYAPIVQHIEEIKE